MSHITVVVPAGQVLPVLDGLLTLYANKAETLMRAAESALDGSGPPDAFADQRAVLAAIDGALEQLGWEWEERGEPVSVTGDRTVLTEAVHAGLVAAAEQLRESCDALALPDGDPGPIGHALARTGDAYALLLAVMEHGGA